MKTGRIIIEKEKGVRFRIILNNPDNLTPVGITYFWNGEHKIIDNSDPYNFIYDKNTKTLTIAISFPLGGF